jgi:hypothetical protein
LEIARSVSAAADHRNFVIYLPFNGIQANRTNRAMPGLGRKKREDVVPRKPPIDAKFLCAAGGVSDPVNLWMPPLVKL